MAAVVLGPFVGIAENHAKLTFIPDTQGSYVLLVDGRSLPFVPGGPGLEVSVTGLTPDTSYPFEIQNDQGAAVHDGSGLFTTLVPAGTDSDLRFALCSCHQPFTENGDLDPDQLVMWKDLARVSAEANPPRFLLALGDQIYEHSLWKDGKPRKAYRKSEGADKARMVKGYEAAYKKFLGLPEVRSVTSRLPTFMIWDDHEIRDGWGSSPKHDARPDDTAMFEAAEDVYDRFELGHNPYPRPSGGYAFRSGKVGIVMLDLRRYRSASTGVLVSDAQKKWFTEWLAADGAACDVICIGCSVPFFHLDESLIESRYRKALKWIFKLASVSDEIVDQWNSPNFAKDFIWLADLLFDTANKKGTRFVLMGGDVHVATIGVLRSLKETHETHPAIYQFTASPIGRSPIKLVKTFMPKDIEVIEKSGYTARHLEILAKKNFGIVDIKKVGGSYAVTFELHHEDGIGQPMRFPTLF